MPDDTPRSRPIRLIIDSNGSDGPIQGDLIQPHRRPSHFAGWLALTTLIESRAETVAERERADAA
jgi:hypothetical protein